MTAGCRDVRSDAISAGEHAVRSPADRVVARFASGHLSFADAARALRSGEPPVRAEAAMAALQRAIDSRLLPFRLACLLYDAVAAPAPAADRGAIADRIGAADLDRLIARLRAQLSPPGAPAARVEPRIGQVLRDRFVLDAAIGQGGMGAVYRAIDRRRQELDTLSPFVAIKMLAPRWAGDRTAMRALEAEARHTQALRHPNIVAVHDFDRDGADAFIVMENLVGHALDVMLDRYPGFAGSALARATLTQLLDGLAAAHARSVIHADLKPSNLFICTDGDLKILDFGIAAILWAGGADSATGRAITPAYASPERLSGQPQTLRDDVYALGCLIHLFLTGRHPFARLDAREARRRGCVPRPITGVSDAINALVARALSFDPAARPVNACEVQAGIRFP